MKINAPMLRFKLYCRSASSTHNVAQVADELANVRQEAEKLSAQNESLNKNYESLLKVKLFIRVLIESLTLSVILL